MNFVEPLPNRRMISLARTARRGPNVSPNRDSTLAKLKRALAQAQAERDEALAQQTATSDILNLIARSRPEGQPVFGAIVASAARVCEAEFSAVAQFDEALLHLVAV